MQTHEFTFKSADQQTIHVYEFLPDNTKKITGVLQIAHGMAEHAKRYADFANFLTDNGVAVYANDHRGHGKTAGAIDRVGILNHKTGWHDLVSDLKQLTRLIQEKHPDRPIFLFGHSMGSFAIRTYLTQIEVPISGAIISGTAGNPGLLGVVGRLLTKVMMIFNAPETPSPFMDKLSFGAFNKPFKPNRTKFDWLSRDETQVDKYVADPYCGGVFTLGFFNQMLTGLLYVSKQKSIEAIPKDLPILIFAGAADPVGDQGKGVTEVYEKYKKAGIANLEFKLFPEGRHESINEINKDAVYQLVLEWLSHQSKSV